MIRLYRDKESKQAMGTAAKVSQHIPDISPTLKLRRDKAFTTYPSNRKRYALPRMEVINEIETNYAWDHLPNMTAFKSAIVRNKVCEGLMYLLPSDKNNTSLARPYTADLGAIFQEPYHRFKPKEYNDENVKQSSKIHFSPNTHITRLKNTRQVERNPRDLNNACRQSYNEYNTLVQNSEERRDGAAKASVHVAVKAGAAELALQKEVKQILDDVGVNDVLNTKPEGDERNTSTKSAIITNTQAAKPGTNRKSQVDFLKSQQDISMLNATTLGSVRHFRGHDYKKKSAIYKDFIELRTADVPRPKVPTELTPQYLTPQKIDDIWNWLHWDYQKTNFEHFVDVCS